MIARVFPRRTKATPTDEYAFVGDPPLFIPGDITEVHISVSFTWDIPESKRLVRAWEHIAPTKIGGPAIGTRGEEFIPGKYLKQGYTITSRGCPNNCWFCSVPKRDGIVRELKIQPGNIIQDDNILATSKSHFQRVVDMLCCQSAVQFTGGLEASRLTEWHVQQLERCKPKQLFFAFDSERDYQHLVVAARLLQNSKIARSSWRCYVLMGYPRDTIGEADVRLNRVLSLGFVPMAMLWCGHARKTNPEWRLFQRQWARPAITKSCRKIYQGG